MFFIYSYSFLLFIRTIYIYILRVRNGKNLPDFIEEIELTRILQKDKNSLGSVGENNTY